MSNWLVIFKELKIYKWIRQTMKRMKTRRSMKRILKKVIRLGQISRVLPVLQAHPVLHPPHLQALPLMTITMIALLTMRDVIIQRHHHHQTSKVLDRVSLMLVKGSNVVKR